MSGSGGDGGAGKRQAEIEAKKQAARDQLNLLFGQAPASAPMVNKADFLVRANGTVGAPDKSAIRGPFATFTGGLVDNFAGLRPDSSYDMDAYNKAVAEAGATNETAAKNKAARDALYADIRGNAYTAGKRGIDEQTSDAKRNLKFELFAKGLNGGSTDIDQNARLQRTYDTGILNLGAKADSAAADVRSNDESTRLGLLQSIDAGMDQSSAISSALNQLKINSDKAASGATQTAIDDLFGNSGLLYQQSQQAKGVADARNAALYGNGGASKQKAYTGTISGV